MSELPESGSVLGVDIGWSPDRPSSAVCRLDWNSDKVTWSIKRFRATEPERSDTLHHLADRALLVAAFDGPLRSDLQVIGRYRHAERMLTRGLQNLIGKPGQSSAPVGKKLNLHANMCAETILTCGHLAEAAHTHAIHATAIVEAFPSTFLGLMIAEPTTVQARRRNRSDTFYEHLASMGGLQSLVTLLLPKRRNFISFEAVGDHDERAALVCALSALCVAARDYVVVGDEDGWIVLPPRALIQPWAWNYLKANAENPKGGLEFCPQ